MYSAGRKARLDEGESELFDDLSLVGVGGMFCGVLTERQLTFENWQGHGIRINLSNISTLRNINLARLPNGFFTMGALGVWVGSTIITPPLGWGIAGLGALSAFGYLTLKTPVLAIETNAGDKHLVSGSQSELLRLCMMIDRVMHGTSIEEAKAGLRALEAERARRMAPEPKALLSAPESASTTGLDIFEAETVAPASGVPSASPAAALIASSAAQSSGVTQSATSQYGVARSISPSPSNFGAVGHSSFDEGGIFAALEAHEPQSHNTPPPARAPTEPLDNRSAYERAWGRPESPSWYQEKDGLAVGENRMDEAMTDAMGSLDLFQDGGIFDTPSPANTAPPSRNESDMMADFSLFDDDFGAPNQTPSYSSPTSTSAPTSYTSPSGYSPPTSTPVVRTPTRPPSSSEMIRSARSRHGSPEPSPNSGWGLPTPTETAVREECRPGLVKTAKARTAWQSETQTRSLQTRATEAAAAAAAADSERFGEEFPAVQRLASSMNNGRVRNSGGRPKKQNWLASLLAPSPTERYSGYAEVYGDADGSAHSGEARFKSGQILRLRSDQDHQADVVGRMRQANSAPSPSSARDALDNVVSRVSRGEERAPRVPATSNDLRFSQLRPTTQKGDGRLPGIRQLD